MKKKHDLVDYVLNLGLFTTLIFSSVSSILLKINGTRSQHINLLPHFVIVSKEFLHARTISPQILQST